MISDARIDSGEATLPSSQLGAMPPLCYGIPNINLHRHNGGEINPSTFVGHELVVFFCPADPVAAAREIESYSALAEAFVAAGAWLICIFSGGSSAETPHLRKDIHITLACDQDGSAWDAFESLLETTGRAEEAAGGAFLFERGGCLAKAWPGTGHAENVLNELHRRA